ncbi:hypothetical protein D3C87_1735660 [compost metagenome]
MPFHRRPWHRRSNAQRCGVDERVRAEEIPQYFGRDHVQWLLVRRNALGEPGHGVDPAVGMAGRVLCRADSAVGLAIADTPIA